MYSENPARDALFFVKALLSNQLARFAPSLYVRLTHQTGRGGEAEIVGDIADYFIRCFNDYFEQFEPAQPQLSFDLKGKKVLEYGPGDLLGIALLMYAHGAASVDCVDRFSLERMSGKNIDIYKTLLDSLDGEERARAESAFKQPGLPESGFNPDAITYSITADGLSGRRQEYDLIIPRAVLEHVNDLEKTLKDVSTALKPDGISIHKVDLKSHGLDRYQAFDFLTWPNSLYRLMYSHKGFPNRWRLDKYREWVDAAGLRFRKLVPDGRLEPDQIRRIQPALAKPFRHLSAEDLSWLAFWMVLEPV